MPLTAPGKEILHIDGLTKAYGAFQALKGIDLRVHEAELLFLIGPSGSGKSTLLRCCNRLEEPTAGTIRFKGEDVGERGVDINQLRRRMGMVFQSFNLYPHLTALGNVTLALRHALSQPKAVADEAGRAHLARVGLGEKADAYPHELSGGQQQRVAIARALALSPEILLMDEPTSALDPELVGSVLRVIRELRTDGMTMLIVSHEMAFAREACDRVAFLDAGEIVEEGPPERIFEAATEPRTRAFLERLQAR